MLLWRSILSLTRSGKAGGAGAGVAPSLFTALTHSDRFRTGVAVAPVTDWRNYDSIYTERYMSLPAEFQSGYKDFSVVNSAAKLKGHLLLVHGTGDDNVHLENTVQFVQQTRPEQRALRPLDLSAQDAFHCRHRGAALFV